MNLHTFFFKAEKNTCYLNKFYAWFSGVNAIIARKTMIISGKNPRKIDNLHCRLRGNEQTPSTYTLGCGGTMILSYLIIGLK